MKAYGKTTQDIYLMIGFKEDFELSEDECNELNDYISDVLYDQAYTHGAEIDDYNDVDFFTPGTVDSSVYHEFTERFNITIYGSYSFYPGVHTLPNGDPGYPDESEWEPYNGFIEDIDNDVIKQKLYSHPILKMYMDDVDIRLLDYDDDFDIEEDYDYDDYED